MEPKEFYDDYIPADDTALGWFDAAYNLAGGAGLDDLCRECFKERLLQSLLWMGDSSRGLAVHRAITAEAILTNGAIVCEVHDQPRRERLNLKYAEIKAEAQALADTPYA